MLSKLSKTKAMLEKVTSRRINENKIVKHENNDK